MDKSVVYDLAGIKHSLQPNDGVIVTDHGGSGAGGAACVYDAIGNLLRGFYHKFGPEISPDEVLLQLAKQSGIQPKRIVYGVAAPVKNNQSAAGVHTPYAVNGNELQKLFPSCQSAKVLNDYGLLCWRLQMPVPREQRQNIQQGRRRRASEFPDRITVIGPGSGLGTGRLVRLPSGEFLIEELEAGHAPLPIGNDIMPTRRIHGDLIPWWTAQYGTVNADTVLCGSGLLKLLRYLVEVHRYPLPRELKQFKDESRDKQPEAAHADHLLLVDYALRRSEPTCAATVELFMELLGRFTQNAAFFHAPRDSYYQIYYGGGLFAGLLAIPYFMRWHGRAFTKAFTDTRELIDQQWLQNIPVRAFLDPRAAALHGAAIAAACMEV